jgi:hypothetical protein
MKILASVLRKLGYVAPVEDEDEDAPASRLYHPSERTCPPAVLRDLRTIDPAAELLYVGRGRWWLAVVRWDWNIVRDAAKVLRLLRQGVTRMEYGIAWSEQLERAKSNAERATMMRLGVQGFRGPIAEYTYRDPDSRIVEDFRLRDWNYRVCPEETVNESIAYASGEPQLAARIATLKDAARTRGWDALRHVVRGKGFVTNLGVS